MLTAFVIGNFYAGLPYHDVVESGGELSWGETVKRNDNYNRVDLKVQLCEPVTNNRTLMEYDAYILISDLTGLIDNPHDRTSDSMNPLYHLNIGLRVHLRF